MLIYIPCLQSVAVDWCTRSIMNMPQIIYFFIFSPCNTLSSSIFDLTLNCSLSSFITSISRAVCSISNGVHFCIVHEKNSQAEEEQHPPFIMTDMPLCNKLKQQRIVLLLHASNCLFGAHKKNHIGYLLAGLL